MNELTFLIAVLVRKDILSADEARSLIKTSKEGVINGNLGDMIAKVDVALKPKPLGIEKIDAKKFLND